VQELQPGETARFDLPDRASDDVTTGAAIADAMDGHDDEGGHAGSSGGVARRHDSVLTRRRAVGVGRHFLWWTAHQRPVSSPCRWVPRRFIVVQYLHRGGSRR